MSRLAGLIGLLLALVLLPAAAFSAPPSGPQFPALTGRVVDDAHVLSAEQQADLTSKLAALEQQTSRQLVVVTLPSLGGYDIADYSNQLLRHWGIGQKGTNNGVLFVVVPAEHKVRVEVGYGLEDVLTDALSSVILQRAVLPKFRSGDIPGGVVDGTNALIQQLSADPSTAEQNIAQAERAPVEHRGNPLGAIVPFIILFFIFSRVFGRRRGGGGWFWPLLFLSGSRGWGGGGGGWGDGGGFGGGGFSGGGGSGGGGGASGSW